MARKRASAEPSATKAPDSGATSSSARVADAGTGSAIGSENEPRAKGGGDVSRSVQRALNILLDVTHNPRPQSFSDLQKRHRLPKATLHKILATLETMNFLRRNEETGKYTVGLAVLEISSAAASGPEDLSKLFAPLLERLVRDWKETCHFGVLDGHDEIILQRVDPPDQMVRLGPLRTHRNPLHASAGGLVLLAAMDDDSLIDELPEDLPQSTPNTIKSRAELSARVAEVRKAGYALDMEEAYIGVRCVAVGVAVPGWPPIYVSFSLPLQRASVEHLMELSQPLREAAREIAKTLAVLPRT